MFVPSGKSWKQWRTQASLEKAYRWNSLNLRFPNTLIHHPNPCLPTRTSISVRAQAFSTERWLLRSTPSGLLALGARQRLKIEFVDTFCHLPSGNLSPRRRYPSVQAFKIKVECRRKDHVTRRQSRGFLFCILWSNPSPCRWTLRTILLHLRFPLQLWHPQKHLILTSQDHSNTDPLVHGIHTSHRRALSKSKPRPADQWASWRSPQFWYLLCRLSYTPYRLLDPELLHLQWVRWVNARVIRVVIIALCPIPRTWMPTWLGLERYYPNRLIFSGSDISESLVVAVNLVAGSIDLSAPLIFLVLSSPNFWQCLHHRYGIFSFTYTTMSPELFPPSLTFFVINLNRTGMLTSFVCIW